MSVELKNLPGFIKKGAQVGVLATASLAFTSGPALAESPVPHAGVTLNLNLPPRQVIAEVKQAQKTIEVAIENHTPVDETIIVGKKQTTITFNA